MFYKKNRFIFAFLGTDGSGKSTIIERITPLLESRYGLKVRYEHLRPNFLPSIAVALGKRTVEEEQIQVVGNPHNVKSSGLLGSLFRLFYYLFDYTIGYFIKVYFSKKTIWLFDRYYYDFIIDQKRFKIKLPTCLLAFCETFIPNPDLLICLGSLPEIIYKRKPETSLEEVTQQTEYLKKLVQKKKNAVWIDTGVSIDTSVNELFSEIERIIRHKVRY